MNMPNKEKTVAKILACGVFLVIPAQVFAQQPSKLSPKEMLDKMVAVYASCTSYADEGESKAVFLKLRKQTVRRFSTAFVRPSQFRFESIEDDYFHNDCVVWQDGPLVRSWWSRESKVRPFELLGQALGEYAGVSNGSSIHVPSMLFGDLGDTQLIQKLSGLVFVAEERIGGRPANQIKGKDSLNGEWSVWIDQETFLLLKIFVKESLPTSGEVEETITYKPSMNTSISKDKLSFKH